jgi:DNA-binding response OmpR family regulator
MPTRKILLVENDDKNREILKSRLQHAGFCVRAISPMNGANMQGIEGYHLLILCLPSLKLNLEEALWWIGEWQHKSILILSDAHEPATVVRLLDAGADDFIPRSCRYDELLARVRACFRRGEKFNNPTMTNNRITINGFSLDLDAKRAFIEDRDIHLTRTEFMLLAELARQSGRICTHEELLGKVWGGEYWDANHYLHVYFGRIRKKLGSKYSALLETVAGMGYIFHSTPHEAAVAAAG